MMDILMNNQTGTLEKEEVGKVKSPRYQLPETDFTYGKFVVKDGEGAGEVIKTWSFHSASNTPSKSRDFKVLNKLSVHNGLCESKGIRDFRKDHNAYETPKSGQKALKVVLPEENFIYGNPNKPSTPINAVLSNEYGMRAALVAQEIYKSHAEESHQHRGLSLPKITNSTRVSHEKVAKRLETLNNTEQKPLFKLKQFQATSPKVNTVNKEYIAAATLRSPKSSTTKAI